MFENWFAMEQFYYTTFPTLILIASLIAVLLIAIIWYMDSKHIRPLGFGMIASILVIAGYLTLNYFHYQDRIDLAAQLNPSVRNYEKKMFLDFRYSSREIKTYRESYQPYLFDKLPFYEEAVIEEEIKYKGSYNGRAYLQIGEESVYVNSNKIEFSNQVDRPIRQGLQYNLVDSQFESIGFVPSSQTYHRTYLVPKFLEDKKMDSKGIQSYSYIFGQVENWYVSD